MIEKQRFVGYQPDTPFNFDGVLRHRQAQQFDAPRCRRRKPHQHADGGSFTGAVRAEESKKRTSRNFQVEAIHRGFRPINFLQITYRDGRG